MVKIRLRRMGAKKAPFYRVVVADSRYPRDGRFIEEIGTYNPCVSPAEIKIDAERAQAWIKSGAQPTDTVRALLKKVEVALRRVAAAGGTGAAAGKTTEGTCYRDDFLQLDFEALTAVRGGEKLSITPNEYKLLRLLVANAGNVVTRRLLLEKLWDCDGNFIDDHTLTVTMNRLRAKIEDKEHVYIKTVRGMGYIWEKT